MVEPYSFAPGWIRVTVVVDGRPNRPALLSVDGATSVVPDGHYTLIELPDRYAKTPHTIDEVQAAIASATAGIETIHA